LIINASMTQLHNLARRYWYFALLIFLIAVAFSIKEALTQTTNGDPYIYWAVGRKFLLGQPLYEPVAGSQEFLYPPVAVLFCQLLALMPFSVAVGLFTFINFMAWLALLGLTYRLLRVYFPQASLRMAMVVGFVATIRYFWHNIVWVNVNELVMLLSLGGLLVYLKGRQTAGLGLLTLAMWIKVMPLLIIGVLFIRRPKATLGPVVAFSGVLLLLVVGFRGINQGIQDYFDYWHITFKPFLLEGKVFTDWIAFGISATLSKLLIAHPAINGIDYNIVSWPPSVVGKISLVLRLSVVGFTFYYAWLSRNQTQLPLLIILLLYLTILLVSGVSWEGHHVTLLLVISGLYQLLSEWEMPTLRRWLVISSVGVGLVTSDLVGSHLSDYLQAFSLITYNVLFLYLLAAWATRKVIKLRATPSTQKICAALMGIAICSSCSRPVACFQPEASSSFATAKTQPGVTATPVQAAATPVRTRMSVEAAPVPIEAHLPNEGKLATATKLNERITRVTHWLTPKTLKLTAAHAPHKPTFVERRMLRKVNKKIGQHLAPSHSKKAMVANRARLIGGLVLLVVGVLLILSGSGRQLNGTVGFIGLFVLLFGIVGVILGLFGE
jgi:hypothetical protein